jgi:hypothetical protein
VQRHIDMGLSILKRDGLDDKDIIVVLLDSGKNKCRKGPYINLEKTTHLDEDRKLDIVKNLEPNACGIDRSKIRQS